MCLQLVSGDVSAQNAAHHQPAKLAAMEAHFHTEAGAALWIGGFPDPTTGRVRGGISIPRGLSLLAMHDRRAVIHGLEEVPTDQRPNVVLCHLAFETMVAAGFALLAVGFSRC